MIGAGIHAESAARAPWRPSSRVCALALALSTHFLFAPIQPAHGQSLPLQTNQNILGELWPTLRQPAFLAIEKSVVSGVLYDSNLFEDAENPADDWIVFSAPSVQATVTRKRSVSAFRAGAALIEYTGDGENSYQDLNFGAEHIFRPSSKFELATRGSAAYSHEERSSQNDDIPDNAAEPVPSFNVLAGISARRTLNRIALGAGYEYSNTNYFDVAAFGGGEAEQDFRDEEKHSFEGLIEVTLSPRVRFNVLSSYVITDVRGGALIVNRDQTEGGFVAGLSVDLTPKITASVNAGARRQFFESPLIDGDDLLTEYSAGLEWKPRAWLSAQIIVARKDSGVDFEDGGVSSVDTSLTARLKYLPSRYLGLSLAVTLEESDEGGGVDPENSFTLEAGLTYKINSRVEFTLVYFHDHLDSSPDESFERDVLQTSLSVRF